MLYGREKFSNKGTVASFDLNSAFSCSRLWQGWNRMMLKLDWVWNLCPLLCNFAGWVLAYDRLRHLVGAELIIKDRSPQQAEYPWMPSNRANDEIKKLNRPGKTF